MFKENYKEEIQALIISKEYKQRLIDRLYEEILCEPKRRRSDFPLRQCTVFAAVAVCLLAAVVIYPFIMHSHQPILPITGTSSTVVSDSTSTNSTTTSATNSSQPSNSPMLTFPSSIFGEGAGTGGFLAYSVDELLSSNSPWTKDARISKLPVYKNPLDADEIGTVYGGGIPNEDLKLTIQRLADLFHIEMTPTYDMSSELCIEKNGVTIGASKLGGFRVFMSEANANTEYFRKKTESETESEYPKLAIKQFMSQYSELFNFTKPVISTNGDYNFDGDKHWLYTVYESEGSLEDQILSYNFNNAIFNFNDKDSLYGFDVNRSDSYETVGWYPIITAEQAQGLLLNGTYYSQSFETPTESDIVAVDFAYQTYFTLDYFMPYYLFYVESHEVVYGLKDGLKVYDVYYVPAIPSQYFTNYDSIDLKYNR